MAIYSGCRPIWGIINNVAIKDQSIAYARQKIEKAMEVAEAEHRRKLLTRRLELARSGIAAYERREVMAAVKYFHTYIRILEEIKGVPEGGLAPAQFDLKKDLSELLMISGIYWDLVKIYDRTRSAGKRKEFVHYLDKYVAFSKNMPFQPVCSESLRKYIQGEKPVHRVEFSNAYRSLEISKCFVVTSLVDVTRPPTLRQLRRFRDEKLRKYHWGRHLIRSYYRLSPFLVRMIDRLPDFVRRLLGKGVDALALFTQRKFFS